MFRIQDTTPVNCMQLQVDVAGGGGGGLYVDMTNYQGMGDLSIPVKCTNGPKDSAHEDISGQPYPAWSI